MAIAAAPLVSASHPHLCYDHARKESHARAAEQIGRDVSYFFSGRYLSACDLTAVLARLFSAAAASGELKPKTRLHSRLPPPSLAPRPSTLAQHEYINAFGTDAWRDAIHTSVESNHDHLYPRDPNDPDPEDESEDEFDDSPEIPTPTTTCTPRLPHPRLNMPRQRL